MNLTSANNKRLNSIRHNVMKKSSVYASRCSRGKSKSARRRKKWSAFVWSRKLLSARCSLLRLLKRRGLLEWKKSESRERLTNLIGRDVSSKLRSNARKLSAWKKKNVRSEFRRMMLAA